MTEATIDDVPAIVAGEADKRAQSVADAAAAQINQANKDAEAIARAAESTHLGTRLQTMHEENTAWRAQMEQNLAASKAETAAALSALQASTLEALSKAATPPPIVETPPLENASVEQGNNSNETDTTKEKTAESKGPPPRLRRVL